jgi:protein-S-isoprenylcysteine O-methyltransferase Ste14
MKKDTFRIIKLVHLGVSLSLLVGIAIVIFVVQSGHAKGEDASLERILQTVAVVLSVGILLIGFNRFKRAMLAARNNPGSGEERMRQYVAACITWWAMIEMPGIFAAICYFLTQNFAFIVLASTHFLILLIFMPRKENIIVLLNLNPNEVAKLEGKN